MMSYLGRINYSLDNKYNFTVTGRVDASSKFAKGNQYAFFPSAAFAWTMSEEEFMQDVDFINTMKMRVSYGAIGNQAIGSNQSLSLVGPYGEGVFNSPSGSEIYTGNEPTSYANKNLKWETTNQFDVGLDLTMLSGRVSLTADYYYKKTIDLLYPTPIPTTTGFNLTLLNIGNLTNRGLDLDLRTINTKGVIGWNSAFNISFNRNRITKLSTEDEALGFYNTILRVGESVGSFYGYEFMGIFQTDQEAATSPVLIGQEPTGPIAASRAKAGDRKYRDVNGDNKVDADDRIVLGTGQPKFTWGFNNSLSYKNFDFNFFFQGSYGNKLANFNNINLLNFTGENNVLAEAALNRWTSENPSTKYPRALAAGSLDVGTFSSAIVEDASYMRLKNIMLSYNIGSSVLTKLKISSARVYVSATNLWTRTDYTGYDPEANISQSTSIIGVDYGGYPQSKVYLIGLNLGF